MNNLPLKIIIEELNRYIHSVETVSPSDKSVLFGSIGEAPFAGGSDEELSERVVVSLVNIAEEGSIKNLPNLRKLNGNYEDSHPVVHVNLFLLFTANFANHERAIERIFRVIEFFQSRKTFSFKNAPSPNLYNGTTSEMKDIEITMEIHTLSFEQLNDLWGSLGGKQRPFVMYRARLIPLQFQQLRERGGLITEIDLNTLNASTLI